VDLVWDGKKQLARHGEAAELRPTEQAIALEVKAAWRIRSDSS
jgi:hypothetical protein